MKECRYEGPLPCWAVPNKECFGQANTWKFQVPEKDKNADRSLSRHEELHRLAAGEAPRLRELASKITRQANGFACECGFVHAHVSKMIAHKCKSTVALPLAAPKCAPVPARKVGARLALAALSSEDQQPQQQQLSHALESGGQQPSSSQQTHAAELEAQQLVAQQLRCNREGSCLHLLNLASSSLAVQPAWRSLPDRPVRPGDFLPHPLKRSWVRVQAVHSPQTVSVLHFRPFPLSRGPCAKHQCADAGSWHGCWRAVPGRPLTLLTLPPGHTVPAVAALAPRPGSSSKADLSQCCFRRVTPLDSLPQPTQEVTRPEETLLQDSARMLRPGGQLEEALPSDDAASLLKDVTTKLLAYRSPPVHCPMAASTDGPCKIIKRGVRPAGKFITATGCWACSSQIYSCNLHNFRWNLPVGCNTSGATLVGDVLGHFLVHASFWPAAWEIYHVTESYVALERHVRRVAEGAVSVAVAEHALLPTLTQKNRAYVHAALLQHCLETPEWKTLRTWLLRYMLNRCSASDVISVATEAIACHGAMCNIDFSCSDGKQLQQRKKRRSVRAKRPVAKESEGRGGLRPKRLKQSKMAVLRKLAQLRLPKHSKDARRWGGCTGLGDVPLLPPLWTNAEDNHSKMLLLQVFLRLSQRSGSRPLAINVDDLEASFHLITSAVELTFPAPVKRTFVYSTGLSKEDRAFLSGGGVLIDRDHFQVYGLWLGQDPLHVYFRLSEAVNWQSLDAAWMMRCLRKLLRSWNYESYERKASEDHVRAEHQPMHQALDWLPVSCGHGGTLQQVLQAYFHGLPCPRKSYTLLANNLPRQWLHPDSGLPLPDCAKAVVMDDMGRKTCLSTWSRVDVAREVQRRVYTKPLTADRIRADMEGLASIAKKRLFSNMAGQGTGAWAKAQMQYLKHVRKRPGGLKAGGASLRLTDSTLTAGSAGFDSAVQRQCRRVTLQGLLAAHHAKRWAVLSGFQVSLGTVGTERLWRNWQRMARNRARSHADAAGVHLLVIQRWLRELQTRAARADRQCAQPAALAACRATGELLSRTICQGPDFGVCLGQEAPLAATSIFEAFLDGQL